MFPILGYESVVPFPETRVGLLLTAERRDRLARHELRARGIITALGR
ncbi:MAG TPA: hypothetical protein VI485_28715 [Vicinamibacterales bacterium]|nr:hypothetical protein [Vicinamibacterales bacterium]